MTNFTLSALLRAIGWLVPWALRAFFSEAWFRGKVAIDLRPRHDQVSLTGGELPEVVIWLKVDNGSDFEIQIDRMLVELVCGAARVPAANFERRKVPPHGSVDVMIRAPIGSASAAHIASVMRPDGATSVAVRAEFNSPIRNFGVDTGLLSGVRPVLQSFNQPAGVEARPAA